MSISYHEAVVFKEVLQPEDSYDSEGRYWADLPFMERRRFVSKINKEESSKEWKEFKRMVKQDPLSPLTWYIKNRMIPGAGMALEGFVLFSIGNVQPLLEAAFAPCWKEARICKRTWLQAVFYLEIVGIICGQIFVGMIGDVIGRRWGMIQDAFIMFLGLVMLATAWAPTQNGWVIAYAWSIFVYGIGVGGEYPMTAANTLASVGNSKEATRHDRLHRGRKLVSTFMMQGWGQLSNQLLLIVLLLIFDKDRGTPPYSESSAHWTYKLSFGFTAIGTLWLVYYRAYHMDFSPPAADNDSGRKVTGYDAQLLKMIFSVFGSRMLATAGAWFCNDMFFFGNKLFQAQFIAVLVPGNTSVMVGWKYNLLNVSIALTGYLAASFLVDHKFYGRRRMMTIGFFCCFVLFMFLGFRYEYYASPKGIKQFQGMYFLSSFFSQFGPNCVTFLVAAEVYPGPIRATAHGLSAAAGKLGALTAATLYNYIDTRTKFYVGPWMGLLGAIITFFFLPDTTGLDLNELERRWTYIKAGRSDDYHGIAIHPSHLSLWERFRGVGKHYNPALDYRMRVEELRQLWQRSRGNSEADQSGTSDIEWSKEMSDYFARSSDETTENVTVQLDFGL